MKFIGALVGGYFKKALNFTQKLVSGDTVFIVPRIYGMSVRSTEPWMSPLLEKIRVLRSGTFIDVGVNVGQTLLKVKSVDMSWDYLGFEPNPACVFFINEIIRLNNIPNSMVLPVGLAEAHSVNTLNLFSDSPVGSAATFVPEQKQGTKVVRSVSSVCVSYNELPRKITDRKISVIKIDVEGFEPVVLKSLDKIIKRDRPYIFFEVLPAYDSSNHPRVAVQEEIESFFEENDYRMFRVAKLEDGGLNCLNATEKLAVHSDLSACDYIACCQTEVGKGIC